MKGQFVRIILVFCLLSLLFESSLCQQPPGSCNNVTELCQTGLCCSKDGFCGTGFYYCSHEHCQSQCPDYPPSPPPPPIRPSPPPPPPPPSPISSVISKEMFEEMLKNRNNDSRCAVGFYTYESFIAAAKIYPEFGNTGDLETRKREIAAFFGQTSHETTGGRADDGGPFAWGYCFKEEQKKADYCDNITSTAWPCVPGKQYYGRGPINFTWNYNYGPFGNSTGIDLLSYPEIVAEDATISFEAAIWFWMTAQGTKPSCHDVIVENWIPSQCDLEAGRRPGYGVITNIINGGLECAGLNPVAVQDRIGFYTRYCDMFEINCGEDYYMDCAAQIPFSEMPCPTPPPPPPANIEMVVASA